MGLHTLFKVLVVLAALRDFKLCVQLAVAKTVCMRHTDRFPGTIDFDLG